MGTFTRFRSSGSSSRSKRAVVLAAVLCVATATLVWLGYRATREAQRSARLLLEQRTAEQLALLWAGLTQDMKGAHATVLVPVTSAQIGVEPPYDLADAFARGFARFPYPEWFFTWSASEDAAGVTHVFTRADRPPPWRETAHMGGPYPVEVVRNPRAVGAFVDRARQGAPAGGPLALFRTTVGGVDYQVVVNLLYGAGVPDRPSGLVGFAVNLEWVRDFYFEELLGQLARIDGESEDVSLQILDAEGTTLGSTRPPDLDHPPVERQFPLVFLDRSFLGILSAGTVGFETWTARASVAEGSRLAAAAQGLDGTFLLISLAALATVAGLVATVRGARAAARLASMKSEFVSSVTHELKTPLAAIQLAADTLVQGRYESPETIRRYSSLLSRESRHLGRLVDNLLAYAQLSDVAHAYAFETQQVCDLVDDALERFQARLSEQHFTVDLDVPSNLPSVRADRSSVLLALDNVIDNAIRYADRRRLIRIRAEAVEQNVAITVEDRGIGIRGDEIERVPERFFRGRNVKGRGSGLGLAITRRIIEAHGGVLGIDSRVGYGTAVELTLPQSRAS